MQPQHGDAASSGSSARSATPISFSLIGNIVISVIAGTVVGVAAVIVDAPSPMVLALIVGLFDLIPQIGSTIAAVIVTVGHARSPAARRRPRSCSW